MYVILVDKIKLIRADLDYAKTNNINYFTLQSGGDAAN